MAITEWSISFKIDADKINSSRFRKEVLNSGLFWFFFGQTISFIIFYNKHNDADFNLAIGIECFVIVFLVVQILRWISLNRIYKKETPNYVEIFNNRITIDSATYFYEDIYKIIASPHSYFEKYIESDRCIQILTYDNEKISTYRFGGSERLRLSAYKDICMYLEHILAESGNFVFDL